LQTICKLLRTKCIKVLTILSKGSFLRRVNAVGSNRCLAMKFCEVDPENWTG
jgi:hypothetical protein